MLQPTLQRQQAANTRVAVAAIVVLLSALRLCHLRLLWADEDYHLAAAINILHGKLPYRDFWYDKPPLSAVYYLLIGGYAGWPLRILDTLYVLVACFLIFRLAKLWWSETEGYLSAILLAFFLTFYLPSAVIAFAADALMVVPHLAAIYFAFSGRAFLAGVCCAAAFLVNAKALFVVAVCALWLFGSWSALALGFAFPLVLAILLATFSGAWAGYYEQVWRWGWIYTAQSPVLHPFVTGLERTINWIGFHAAIAGGTVVELVAGSRDDRWKLCSWLLLSFSAVCLGTRFAPHYFLQLLPAVVIAGARGIVLAYRRSHKKTVAYVCLALLVPFIRFAPRYVSLAYDAVLARPPLWNDVTMDVDAREVAEKISKLHQANDSLFVWGYRPDIYVYTRLTSDGKFWDSQPLTGVPADRHLHVQKPILNKAAAANRLELIKTRPVWIVDGLSLLNPRLRMEAYPEFRPWLNHYTLVGRTKLSLLYKRTG